MEHHRGNVQKDKIQTLTTSGGNDRGVVVNSNIKNINYENGTFSTLGTNCGSSTSAGGGVVVYDDYNSKIRKDQDTIGVLTTNCGNNANRNGWKLLENKNIKNDGTTSSLTTRCDLNGVIDNLRIRKLTPKECGRLMGVKDEDIDKITLSDSAKYHIFGDAIVVNVLMAIFNELLKKEGE